VLFAQDFFVIFHKADHHSKKVNERKEKAWKMLKKLYFNNDLKQKGNKNKKGRDQNHYQYLKFKEYV